MRRNLVGTAGGVMLTVLVLPLATMAQESEGSALYQSRCAVCHGDTGKGDGPAGKDRNPRPPDLSDARRMGRITDARLAEVIVKGGDGMPAYGSILKPEEVQRLVEYLRSLSRPQPG